MANAIPIPPNAKFQVLTGNTKSNGRGWHRYKKKHGMCNTPEYRCWIAMIQRCTNPKAVGWKNYGGRGIKVCQRWLDSFENFLSDMGRRPPGKYEIDRIDNNGHYEPGNCRWATRSQQSINRRTNTMITHNGRTQTGAEWARELSLVPSAIKKMYLGWSIQKLLDTPVNTIFQAARKLEFDGKVLTVSEWSQETGIPGDTIRRRLKSEWSVEESLTTPSNIFHKSRRS